MGRYFDMGIAYEDHWHVDVDGDEAPLDIWACKRVENPPTMRFCVYHEGRRVDFDSTAWAAPPR